MLKFVVARTRPTFDDPVTTASGYAFPSGHALNSMLFAGCLIALPAPRGEPSAACQSARCHPLMDEPVRICR